MNLYGDNLSPSQIVTVNGKLVSADIKELNTDEGWVDIFLPKLDDSAVVFKEGDEINTEEFQVPVFDYEVKRLTGEVKVVELQE